MIHLLLAALSLGAPAVAGSPIAHVIVVIQENRSRDNLFASSVLAGGGPYPGANVSQSTPAEETTLYHVLAQRYALADENFALRLVPTFPSHVFLIAAQSQFSGNPTDPTNWGCDSTPGTTAPIFTTGEEQRFPGIFPCVENQTIGDLLDRAGVTWKYYTGALGNLGMRDVSGDDLSDLFDFTRAKAVPAISELAVVRAIHRSGFSLARANRDTHPVDDDT